MPGGRQDHYAAAFGGALALTFAASGVNVESIPLSSTIRQHIERRFVLVYSGQSRISGETITAVLDGYKTREPRVCNALEKMRALAMEMARLLGDGDLDALGEALAEHWLHQRSLHPKITTERIEKIMEAATRAGAIGGKAMGASGGGCVLVVTRAGSEERVRSALRELGDEIDFEVDQGGLMITERV